MKSTTLGRFIPIALCALAVAALVAAAVLLVDSRDHLTNYDGATGGDFSSYTGSNTSDLSAHTADGDADGDDEVEVPTWQEVDWEALADDEEWAVVEPREDELATDDSYGTDEAAPAGTRRDRQRTGRLVVVTNFTRADVTVNGDPYPSYSSDGQNRGMELTANETHQVVVIFDGNQRIYDVNLRPGERRLLMVELTGMGQPRADSSAPTSRRASAEQRRARARRDQDDDDEEDELDEDEGEITVYSRPRGTIYVGGSSTGESTPSTVDVDPGRHEVQVEYEGGQMSETKTVRVRGGSRIKLFFRQDD